MPPNASIPRRRGLKARFVEKNPCLDLAFVLYLITEPMPPVQSRGRVLSKLTVHFPVIHNDSLKRISRFVRRTAAPTADAPEDEIPVTLVRLLANLRDLGDG